jgi:hypothetical protein
MWSKALAGTSTVQSSDDICPGCGKPVVDGEARWGGSSPEGEWHYDCVPAEYKPRSYEELKSDWEEAYNRGMEALSKLKRILKENGE